MSLIRGTSLQGYGELVTELGGDVRALLDLAHREIAVLHRGGEVAVLERRAHPLVLGLRDLAAEHQGLGAAADRGVPGAHEHLVGPGVGHRHRPDLAVPRCGQPERPCLVPHSTVPDPGARRTDGPDSIRMYRAPARYVEVI